MTDLWIAETLQTHLLTTFMHVVVEAHALYGRHYDNVKTRVTTAENIVKLIDPAADQDIFVDYNIRPFNVPIDWTFEPCATHYDTVFIVITLFFQPILTLSDAG